MADLQRFLDAQRATYDRALQELGAGRKRSHWMWYVFPQLAGLGFSATSQLYGISDLDEARAYLAHPVLGARLLECVDVLLASPAHLTASEIFGCPDDLKLRSCATLFALASPPGSPFERLLDRFYEGTQDERTVTLLAHG